jgi:saccharopine dehydrogenase-like NADP-dependent oxidoreductase
LGFAALQAVIESGRPYADISFMAEDARALDRLARRRGVTAVVDCGVAPGLSNLLAGAAARLLQPCERLEIMVGGLPVERRAPFQYKAAFAPSDVLEEYTRPARMVEGGRVVVKEALGGIEPIDLPGVGTVEAFDTDGLRSLAHTLPVPFMRERTLRWPGHAALMRAFRDAGLFSRTPITVGRGAGTLSIAPREVTAALLFPRWEYQPGERDLTVMRVEATGRQKDSRASRQVRLTWDLLDHLDPVTGFTSMARTTAFPCTIVARLLAEGSLRRPGVIPPELLASEPGVVEHVLRALRRRGIAVALHVDSLPPEGAR